MTPASTVILYAEDSDDDAFLMQRAFSKVNFPGALIVVPNGRVAMEYLAGEGAHAARDANPLPQLVLLDIKMPEMGGLDVLEWIRRHEEFRQLPVIMLTSSSQPTDVTNAYRSGANAYLVKPADLERFRELVEDLIGVCAGPARTDRLLNIRGAIPAPP